MQAARFVRLEHQGAQLGQLTIFLVGNRHEVVCFGAEVVQGAPVNTLLSQVDEVRELARLHMSKRLGLTFL